MTEVFFCNCSCFSHHELFLQGMGILSSFRRKKVNHAKSPLAKYQRLGAGVVLDYALSKRGLCEKEMEYVTDQNGKPFFANHSELFFSLSHSEEWVLCALSDGEIGADIQVISEYNARVSDRCFSKEEAGRLHSLAPELQDREFTRLWAQKEAQVKYFGTWKGQESLPPVVGYSDLEHAEIGVCTYDTPVFCFITDIREILFR